VPLEFPAADEGGDVKDLLLLLLLLLSLQCAWAWAKIRRSSASASPTPKASTSAPRNTKSNTGWGSPSRGPSGYVE